MKFSTAFKSALPAAALGILTLGLAPTPAFAASTQTSTMAVTATVVSSCSIGSTGMTFGNYVALTGSTSTATLTVTCSSGSSYTLGLDKGTTTGGSITSRLMINGAVTLGYGLYTDNLYANNFATLASTLGTGSAQTTTVYGKVPASQYVAAGSYSDSITATVTF